ncbi:MAG: hypothetical protein E4H01_12335 [Lysobacterales bacterium]|nr:MAG: hypothetical protein E4H01_12335 [Xanthomonadales bacterium]
MKMTADEMLRKIICDRERIGLTTSAAEREELERYVKSETETEREPGAIYGTGSEGQDWFSERE